MTIVQLRARLPFWQGILNLPEWKITIKPWHRGNPKNTEGMCLWSAELLTADIWINRGRGEDTLVHELLHIVFEGHGPCDDELYSEMTERAINRTAAALVKLVTGR